jgi:hypothetical protein
MLNIGRGCRREHPIQHFLLLQIKIKPDMRRTYFQTGPLPVTLVFRWRQSDVTSDQNCTTTLVRKNTRGKAGHAQSILPVRECNWRHFWSREWRHFRSRDFWWWSPHMIICPYPYTTYNTEGARQINRYIELCVLFAAIFHRYYRIKRIFPEFM